MNKPITRLFSLLAISLLSGCGIHHANTDAFASLSQAQQAEYWQAQRLASHIHRIQQLGMTIYVQGDEYQILIPANLLFKANTSQFSADSKDKLHAIADLINNQHTPLVKVLAYANTSPVAKLNLGLSESWAESVVISLRQQGLDVGVLSAHGYGDCDNIGNHNQFTNRIEIHYRVSHGN